MALSETFNYLRTFARLPFALRRFRAQPALTAEGARRVVRARLARREAAFLENAARAVYGRPQSPYLRLLRWAGCELGDLRDLVRDRGLEGALGELRRAGVYVTFEEFKGRKPIERPGLSLAAAAGDFDNPLAQADLVRETGGSTGAAARVGLALAHVRATSPTEMVSMAAHGLDRAPAVVWRGILPDGGLRSAFQHICSDRPVRRWFSHYGLRAARGWVRYGLATYYTVAWARLLGVRIPWPEFAPLTDPLPVARGVAAVAKAEGRCLLHAGLSRAVRLCQAALEHGLDLSGAALRGSGEAPTPAKVAWLQRAGMRFVPAYGMTEVGPLGQGCTAPADESDVHLFTDSVALVTHPHAVAGFGVTVPAFNLTTLLPTAPKLLLNVQLDDYGIVEERACGCDLAACGFTTHLRQIRSYSKLTGEGVTLIGSELLQVLERELPARFGGGPLDYQLSEQEDAQGFTRLVLLIHPAVPIADEGAVAEALLAGLSRSSPMADAARVIWQSARTIQVKRAEPVWTARGKLLPLQPPRRAGPAPTANGGS